MRADLAQFYGLNIDDVWAGTLPVRHTLFLAQHLVLNPHSRVFAIRGGTQELQGWDAQTVIAARTHNLIASLIQGLSKTNNSDIFIEYPAAKPEEIRPMTLAEFSSAAFNKFMYE